jgi:DNA-directed RNA polymerase subunit H (RpoH/RPB5)
MAEIKKNMLGNLTIGNLISIAIPILATIVGSVIGYAKLQNNLENHLLDEDIHVNDKTHKILTVEEYKNLIKFATTVENAFPTIKENKETIIEINQTIGEHLRDYEHLYSEQEDSENKLSQVYKELKEDILKQHE